MDQIPLQTIGWILLLGWCLNWFTTGVSVLNDVYWKNLNIAQGFIACAAFAWIPFLVFFAGIKHFISWVIYERSIAND